LTARGELQRMAGIAMREQGLLGGKRLAPMRARVPDDELEVEILRPEVTLGVRDHAQGIDGRRRPEGKRGRDTLGAGEGRHQAGAEGGSAGDEYLAARGGHECPPLP